MANSFNNFCLHGFKMLGVNSEVENTFFKGFLLFLVVTTFGSLFLWSSIKTIIVDPGKVPLVITIVLLNFK